MDVDTYGSSTPDTLSVRAALAPRLIHDFRTYDLFEGLPSLSSVPATGQLWSLEAYFYQGSALDITHLPPIHNRGEDTGSIPYIALPKLGQSAQASIRLPVDSHGTPHFDPCIESTTTTICQESKLARPRKNTSASSLLGSCESFGIVGDPRGHEKLTAFGSVLRTGGVEDEVENENDWWTPDWVLVSEVLPSGTVRRVLEGCGRTHISVDRVLVEKR